MKLESAANNLAKAVEELLAGHRVDLKEALTTYRKVAAEDDGPQCDGAGWVRCGKCNCRLAVYEPCEGCK